MIEEKRGTLYLCATPIGNLEDITYRAVRILKEVDIIAAEDTRHTKKLLNHFEITTPLTSYYRYNKEGKGKILLHRLLKGENIALVSDAGMPGISDPGYELVKLVVDSGLRVVPVPGVSAVTAALAASGLDTRQFYFQGFLPSKKKEREAELQKLKDYTCTLVFYESPHRIKDTLQSISTVLGERKTAVARELTKKFEEFIRGNLSQVIKHFEEEPPKGEFTIVVEGSKLPEGPETVDIHILVEEVFQKVSEGANKKEEIKRIAREAGIPKRELYEAVLKREKKV
ncbi:MAG: rRNA (cytidine1402-2-O)-methyltransferase [Clostridia bacterium]|nr:Ribosomal small subunit methyltransferase [Clostridiales bacterium]MDK2985837.1 rRNA (cytidine1402-2-O)-methyltransferase [Clostridia bacterium]